MRIYKFLTGLVSGEADELEEFYHKSEVDAAMAEKDKELSKPNAKNLDFCPECGNRDIQQVTEIYPEGHYQCRDRDCLQEFFMDVDYIDTLPKVLAGKSKKLQQLESELTQLKEKLRVAEETM